MWFENITQGLEKGGEHILFLFPYSGGTAEVFAALSCELESSNTKVFAFQLPGMGKRLSEPLCNDIGHILDESSPEMKRLIGSQSFSLLGHSTGGLFAYLFAGLMIKEGLCPHHLFIAAESAPHIAEFDSDPLFFTNKEILERLKIYGRIDQEVINNDDFIAFYLPIMRNEFSINFRLKQLLENTLTNVHMTLIHGTKDTHVKRSDIEAWQQYSVYKANWNQVDSDHFFIHDEAKKVAEILSDYLPGTR